MSDPISNMKNPINLSSALKRTCRRYQINLDDGRSLPVDIPGEPETADMASRAMVDIMESEMIRIESRGIIHVIRTSKIIDIQFFTDHA